MTAMPQPRPEAADDRPAPGGSLVDAISPAPDAPPPHRLWATLESAYAQPDESPEPAAEERMVPYLALPMAVGLSLVMWVIIIELVLAR